MKARQLGIRLLLGACLAASFAGAARADGSARVDDVNAPDGTDLKLKAALRASIRQQLTRAHLDAALEGYALSPSLIQLRRYVESAPKRTKLVCIVGIALRTDRGIVADVRGSSATSGMSAVDTIDAAAHAAVERLPSALAQAREGVAAARLASDVGATSPPSHLGQPR
jgi:hypothetical protein